MAEAEIKRVALAAWLPKDVSILLLKTDQGPNTNTHTHTHKHTHTCPNLVFQETTAVLVSDATRMDTTGAQHAMLEMVDVQDTFSSVASFTCPERAHALAVSHPYQGQDRGTVVCGCDNGEMHFWNINQLLRSVFQRKVKLQNKAPVLPTANHRSFFLACCFVSNPYPLHLCPSTCACIRLSMSNVPACLCPCVCPSVCNWQ